MDRRIDIAVAAAFALLGLTIIIEATGIRLGLVRDPIGPRAAFYVCGGVLLLGGLLLIWRRVREWNQTTTFIESEGVADEPDYPASAVRPALLVGSCLIYTALFTTIGYLVATPLFIVAALASVGERNWRLNILIGVIFTIATYVVFHHALGVRIPVGVLTGLFRELGLITL